MTRRRFLLTGVAVLVLLAGCSTPTAPDPPSIIQQQIAQAGARLVPLTDAQRSSVRISLDQAEQTARRVYGQDMTFGFAYLGAYTHTWHPHLPPPSQLPSVPAYVIQMYGPGSSGLRGSWVAINAVDGSNIEHVGPCIGPDCLTYSGEPVPSPSD